MTFPADSIEADAQDHEHPDHEQRGCIPPSEFIQRSLGYFPRLHTGTQICHRQHDRRSQYPRTLRQLPNEADTCEEYPFRTTPRGQFAFLDNVSNHRRHEHLRCNDQRQIENCDEQYEIVKRIGAIRRHEAKQARENWRGCDGECQKADND